MFLMSVQDMFSQGVEPWVYALGLGVTLSGMVAGFWLRARNLSESETTSSGKELSGDSEHSGEKEFPGDHDLINAMQSVFSTLREGGTIQSALNRLVEVVATSTGISYVLLRVEDSGCDSFNLRSFYGIERYGTPTATSFTASREDVERYIDRMDATSPGVYVSPSEAIGIERILASAVAGSDRKIILVPLFSAGRLIGYFSLAPVSSPVDQRVERILRFVSDVAVYLIKVEKLKTKHDEDERALAVCREELESVNQLKSNFLSVISHELRTPLTSIKAYAETLLENLDNVETSTVKEFLNVMDGESERLIKLVDNILSFSYMETGKLRVEKSTFSLNELVEEVYRSAEGDFLSKRINIELFLPRNHVMIKADRELIRQLLNNLINNAIKFSPEGGKVVVSLDEEASSARITVQDSGRGIPEDQLEKVFERFHQVDASDTREHGGSGLGLAICKNIVDWHEGKIWVENVKSSGAKFTVLLPIKDIYVRQSISRGFIGSRRFDRDRYLTLLVELLAEFMQARKASIMMFDSSQEVLRILAAKGLDPEFVQHAKVEVGDRIAGRVVETGQVMHVFDIERESEYGRANNSTYYGTHSFISVPMKVEDKIIGVLNVSDHVEGREFTEHDRELLESISPMIAGLIRKIEAYETVSTNFERLKNAMRCILELRETWGSKLLSKLTILALATARRLNLDERSLMAVRIGMNIYDIGLMKIPRHIRAKKEPLSRSDIEKLMKHPYIGSALLSPMDIDEKVKAIVRSHHEQYDGKGYPDGLKGDDIPIEARIVSVVDAFKALMTPGPYRRTYSLEEAKEEIAKGAGTRFDPKVVSAFLKALSDLGVRHVNGQLIVDAIYDELEKIKKRFKESKSEEPEKAKEVAP